MFSAYLLYSLCVQKSSRGARTLSRTLSFRKARGAPPSGLDSVMVSLEGGEFLMGSNDTAELYPVGRCKLDPSLKAPGFQNSIPKRI